MTKQIFRPDAAHYKVIELAVVTDEAIESVLNTWTAQGWHFDQIQFVVRDASRRPSMAFIFFTRPVGVNDEPSYEKCQLKSNADEKIDGTLPAYAEGDIKWS